MYPTWIAFRDEKSVTVSVWCHLTLTYLTFLRQVTLNTGLALAALVDVITASLLVFYLYRSRGTFSR